MSRFILTIVLAIGLLAGSAASADVWPQSNIRHPVAGRWVGAQVIDREGLPVGPIDRIVEARGGRRAVIIVWGHPSWTPMKTLTMRPDGTVTSTMRRYEIFLTYPGCELC